MTKELKNELAALGADVQGGLHICMDIEELYDTLVKMFVSDKSFEQMVAATTRADYEGAYEYAHALKGITLNIGFTHLSEPLIALMEGMRNSESEKVDELIKPFVEQYIRTSNIIKSMI